MTDATTMAPAPLRAGGQTPGALRRKLWQCAVGAALALLVLASGFILREKTPFKKKKSTKIARSKAICHY